MNYTPIIVDLPESNKLSYPIFIGTDLLPKIVEFMPKNISTVVIITDDIVRNLYALQLEMHLKMAGYTTLLLSFTAGEQSKNIVTKCQLEEKMLAAGCDRQSLILALGGGVVGDLAGFIAATYMRGISYMQLPTTLLAILDSSVGGKTGIDTPYGKNLIGAFWQPIAVLADLTCLQTLPRKQLINGLIEAIKIFLVADVQSLMFLQDNLEIIDSLFKTSLLEDTPSSLEDTPSSLEDRPSSRGSSAGSMDPAHKARDDVEEETPSFLEDTPSSLENIPSSRGSSAGSMDPAHKARDDVEVVTKIVHMAVSLKANIVQQDPREHHKRSMLNFGHTIGHALEHASSYQLLHGYAVALGILVEAKIAQLLGKLSEADFLFIKNLFAKLQITTRIPFFLKNIPSSRGSSAGSMDPAHKAREDVSLGRDDVSCDRDDVSCDWEDLSCDRDDLSFMHEIINLTKLDKKKSVAGVRYVLLNALGSVYEIDNNWVHAVTDEMVLKALLAIIED
jgi:3-dehydroquinate synthase